MGKVTVHIVGGSGKASSGHEKCIWLYSVVYMTMLDTPFLYGRGVQRQQQHSVSSVIKVLYILRLQEDIQQTIQISTVCRRKSPRPPDLQSHNRPPAVR